MKLLKAFNHRRRSHKREETTFFRQNSKWQINKSERRRAAE
jgi:hypothetical protein